MQKQPQKANGYYQKVLDLNKNFAPAANNLAYNYAQYGGNLDVALGLAQKAREEPERRRYCRHAWAGFISRNAPMLQRSGC